MNYWIFVYLHHPSSKSIQVYIQRFEIQLKNFEIQSLVTVWGLCNRWNLKHRSNRWNTYASYVCMNIFIYLCTYSILFLHVSVCLSIYLYILRQNSVQMFIYIDVNSVESLGMPPTGEQVPIAVSCAPFLCQLARYSRRWPLGHGAGRSRPWTWDWKLQLPWLGDEKPSALPLTGGFKPDEKYQAIIKIWF